MAQPQQTRNGDRGAPVEHAVGRDLPPTPRQRYEADLAREGFAADAAQAHAVDALQRVYDDLLQSPPRHGLFQRLSGAQRVWPPVPGLYLWGGVGRGKTYLMDAFFEALPFSRKRRTHFHRFMLEVHERRNRFPDEQDPLIHVADDIADATRVLCFDEFFVADIADAMILGRLFEALFQRGVTLIATSNVPPDGLYKDGLQREQFLPAIDRLKKNCTVLNVDGGTDYRLRTLHAAALYLVPSDAEADAQLRRQFDVLASHAVQDGGALAVNGRDIAARRLSAGVGWFDFEALCEGPRSAADYIEIGRTHGTVLLSGVPRLGKDRDDAARRFMTLVDEFYDRGVKLVIAADVPPERLYVGTRLAFEFERTLSRLQEMQSQEYLAKPHLA